MADPFQIDEADKLLGVMDADGRPAVLLGLVATVYFEHGFEPEMRDAAIECFEEYRALCGDQLRWGTHPTTHHWRPVASLPDNPRSWMLNLDRDESWQLTYQGGASHEEASAFRFEAVGVPAWESAQHVSYVQVCLPLTWYVDHDGSFPDLLLRFCRRLQPMHGYGGIGIIDSFVHAVRQRFETTVFAMARRFPGLEFDIPVSHSLYVKNGIKGVNWLTVLGEPWLSKVGGAGTLAAELGPDYTFSDFGSGVMIQAGPRPQLGDRNRELWPEQYARLARLLRPIRITEHRSFHEYGPARFTQESTEEWLARFDRPSSA